jgi:hypothetical protein
MATQIDAAHVLSSYSAALMQNDKTLVRDLEELPYPKEVIKAVIKHCIRIAGPGEEREFLRSAYVCLADFQVLSVKEKSLVISWKSGTSANSDKTVAQQQMSNAAQALEQGADVATGLGERVTAEAAALVEELKAAGL